MKAQHRQALERLHECLSYATNCGALDVLLPDCEKPGSINDVCDTITFALGTPDAAGITSPQDLATRSLMSLTPEQRKAALSTVPEFKREKSRASRATRRSNILKRRLKDMSGTLAVVGRAHDNGRGRP